MMPFRPFRLGQCFRPNRLWFRTDQYYITETFQLFKITAINQFIVFPILWCKQLYICRRSHFQLFRCQLLDAAKIDISLEMLYYFMESLAAFINGLAKTKSFNSCTSERSISSFDPSQNFCPLYKNKI